MRCKFSKLNICRLVAAVIAVMMSAALFAPCAFATSSGTCGNGVNWSFADGTLTISGKGSMSNYSDTRPAPWKELKSSIRVVNISSGVTYIGNNAFNSCESLVSVTLPEGLVSIGDFCFLGSHALETLVIPESVTEIGNGVGMYCPNLECVVKENSFAHEYVVSAGIPFVFSEN